MSGCKLKTAFNYSCISGVSKFLSPFYLFYVRCLQYSAPRKVYCECSRDGSLILHYVNYSPLNSDIILQCISFQRFDISWNDVCIVMRTILSIHSSIYLFIVSIWFCLYILLVVWINSSAVKKATFNPGQSCEILCSNLLL